MKRVAAAALALALAAPVARAQAPPPPAQRSQVYSPYEVETIKDALATFGAERELAPEGKIIERIDVLPLNVIEPRDPAPQWVNVFHATTRRYVVRREMLLREGDLYQQVLVDETLRNLRRLPQLSLVLAIATRGSAPDRVGIIVVTKDVWSLRPNWNLELASGRIELLQAQPAETNVLGTHQIASGNFVLEPSTYTLGLGYRVPRIADTRIALVTNANVVFNRNSGTAEGTYGSLVTGKPLYSGLDEWAWDASVTWVDYIVRRYENGELSYFRDKATGQLVPFQYDERAYVTTYELTRSFGWDTNHDFTLAVGIDRRQYRATFPGAAPQTVADFTGNYVPVSDTRVGPSLQYHAYLKRYVRVFDLETLALQEDYRLGPEAFVRVYPVFRALGSSRDFVGLYGAMQYTLALRDGIFRLGVESVTEPETNRIADALLWPQARLVSPTVLGIGRIVLDGSLYYRWRNYLNQTTYLGGDDRLRGYPTNFFVGKDVLSYNVELRTRPLDILTLQLAGVAFYDVGDAFDGLGNLTPFQSVGFGVRSLFPQLDRIVFRMDVGFPIERPIDPSTGTTIAPYAILISLGQAFNVPQVGPPPVLPTGQ